jgi:hypothetical protein
MIQTLTWKLQTNLVKASAALTTPFQHIYGILIENPSTQAISVTCKAFQLTEV